MPRGEVLHDDGPRLDVGGVDELVGLHVKHRLSLAWDLPIGGKQRCATLDDSPHLAVSELLRLARIGAIAEEQSNAAGDTPVRTVVRDARRRWRLELGIL
jgi:hypothetical protein